MKRLFHARTFMMLTAAALIACQPGCSSAKEPVGQAATQSAKQTNTKTVAKIVKKNITGTIGLINPKQHTITIKPVAASQQVQVQADAPKAKAKPSADLLLIVDKRTKIAGAALPRKGEAIGDQQTKGQFSQLVAGQLVRVVYEEPAAQSVAQGQATQTTQAQAGSAAQTAAGRDEAKPKEEPKQSGEGKNDGPPVPAAVTESKSPAAAQQSQPPAQKLPAMQAKPLRAISIDILAPPAQQAKDAERENTRP